MLKKSIKISIFFFLLCVCLFNIEIPNKSYVGIDQLLNIIAIPIVSGLLFIFISFIIKTGIKKEINDYLLLVIYLIIFIAFSLVFPEHLITRSEPYYSYPNFPIFLNVCLLSFFTLIIVIITKRLWIGATITSICSAIISILNIYLLRFRNEILNWGDLESLETALNVADQYNFTPQREEIFVLITTVAIILLALIFLGGKISINYKHILAYPIVMCLFLCIVLNNNFEAFFQIQPTTFHYNKSGYILNLVQSYNLHKIQYPKDFSLELISEYNNNTNIPDIQGEMPQNIIVVMNESFSDLPFSGEIEIDNINALKENTIKGIAYSSIFGGTTANSEYEFLTSNSMGLMDASFVPYMSNKIVYNSYSISRTLKQLGYETIAFHPFEKTGWNRESVYQNFQFDMFYYLGNSGVTSFGIDAVNQNTSDKANYLKVIDIYEKKDKDKLFVFNVTMQNHSPNPDYIKNIEMSDEDIMILIDYFKNIDESTMIVFFGDHQLAMDDLYYEKYLGKAKHELSREELEQLYTVPFFIWTNYDIEEQENVKTSFNFLSTMMFDVANLPLNKYQMLQLKIMERVPVIHGNGFWDNEDNYYSDIELLPEDIKDDVKLYRMIQAQSLIDANNKMEELFYIN